MKGALPIVVLMFLATSAPGSEAGTGGAFGDVPVLKGPSSQGHSDVDGFRFDHASLAGFMTSRFKSMGRRIEVDGEGMEVENPSLLRGLGAALRSLFVDEPARTFRVSFPVRVDGASSTEGTCHVTVGFEGCSVAVHGCRRWSRGPLVNVGARLEGGCEEAGVGRSPYAVYEEPLGVNRDGRRDGRAEPAGEDPGEPPSRGAGR